MLNEVRRPRFDLEERTSKFAEEITLLCERIPINLKTEILVKQLLRAGTSVGANYSEANNSSSKKEFVYRISVCKKEACETRYWLRLLPTTNFSVTQKGVELLREICELILIFSRILLSCKKPKH